MSKDVKKTVAITANQTEETDRTTVETKGAAGSLASKIKQISVNDLRPGDKVLYPGNRLIPVTSVQHFVQLISDNGAVSDHLMYVVWFEGQSNDSPTLAFMPGTMLYIYAD